MNHKRILAFSAALCLMGTAFDANCNFSLKMPAFAENQQQNNSVTLTYIGDKTPITLGGTTETPVWYSDDDKVATVTPTGELSAEITAVGKGTANIYAVLSGQTLKFIVTVIGTEIPTEKYVEAEGTVQLSNKSVAAEIQLSGLDNSKAEWTSTDTSVATVDNKGVVTAVGKGKCIIKAVDGDTTYIINVNSTYEPSENVPVQPEITENKIGDLELSNENPSRQINAVPPEGMTITWYSSDENIAVVDQNGVVKAVGKGSCRIYAEIGTAKYYAEVTSTYSPDEKITERNLGSVSLTENSMVQQITLENIPEGTVVEWSSSDTSVAEVNSEGVITAKGNGTCIVTALIDGIKNNITVNVTLPEKEKEIKTIEINGIGKTIQLSSSGLESAVWSSDNEAVASVDSNGLVKAVSVGEAVITAADKNTSVQIKVVVNSVGMVGDANCDGNVSVADATTILQSIGNRDKYALTEQGAINADVDGVPGVTPIDALTIQKFDAGIITSLPIVP